MSAEQLALAHHTYYNITHQTVEQTTDILWKLALVLSLMIGWLLAVFQLPGTWFILFVSVTYSWHDGWERITWPALAVMAVMAVTGEAVELLAGMKGAQKAGASRAASWGALVGGFCGMIIFTPLIPILIVGSILGGLIGCFTGAFIAERIVRGDSFKSIRVGFGAAAGRLIGLISKLMIAFVMSGIAVGAMW